MAAITFTTVGLSLIRSGISGTNSIKITYVALGTDATAPAVTDTKLYAEVFRKAVTSYVNSTNPGEIFVNMYLAPSDVPSTNIQEVGFFGGSTATTRANTGILIARGLYSHTKQNTESIQFQLDLAFTS
jgi:hypothetical protein